MHIPQQSDGLIGRRVIAIAMMGVCLAGCSSWFSSSAPPSSQPSQSSSFDPFSAPPLIVKLQLDSVPQGAEVRTSLGPGCRTPCEIPLNNPASDFSVTYTLNEFLPVTVPVKVTSVPSSFLSWGGAIVDPNPVVVQLQPVPPPPPPPKRKMRPKRPGAPKAAAVRPAPGSPFPAPPPPTR
jgi:hypothetical protein